LQQLISGVAVGCVYTLVALGFVLIYKATEVVSFTQGQLMMVGAFCGVTFINHLGWPFWAGAGAAIICTALVGIALDRVFVRRMIGQPAFAAFMVTLGISTCIQALVLLVPGWGIDTYKIATPWSGRVIHVGTLVLSADHAVVIAATILCVVGMFVFFRYTRTGLAMQATAQNQLAASYSGIRIKSVFAMIWGIAAATAALAGLLLAPITYVHSNMGYVGLKAIVAAVLGGFGSFPGAILGGILLGVVESMAGFYLPEGVKEVAGYLVLLVVLTFRPTGLLGSGTIKKV
jgi:branched-chain amino acid transport system permease protein